MPWLQQALARPPRAQRVCGCMPALFCACQPSFVPTRMQSHGKQHMEHELLQHMMAMQQHMMARAEHARAADTTCGVPCEKERESWLPKLRGCRPGEKAWGIKDERGRAPTGVGRLGGRVPKYVAPHLLLIRLFHTPPGMQASSQAARHACQRPPEAHT